MLKQDDHSIDDLLSIYVQPSVACVAMLIMGVLYFALAVYIDSVKCNKFKK
jgi:hypothetical protein